MKKMNLWRYLDEELAIKSLRRRSEYRAATG